MLMPIRGTTAVKDSLHAAYSYINKGGGVNRGKYSGYARGKEIFPELRADSVFFTGNIRDNKRIKI